ncbi:hypothetical protein C7S15_8048 [Burkholderia cepacia]|nr:hypothetical protein [Burkholderia cepacia]
MRIILIFNRDTCIYLSILATTEILTSKLSSSDFVNKYPGGMMSGTA